ncbi:MAG: fluoride efflux transporter CrcB [Proteobacteria bacterium]|nr:fluoride efflux transporter CrcB [Pseudomonadota bacterium]
MLVALGGAVGAMARYSASLGIHGIFGHGFPYGTLLVNVVGSFIIGLLYIVITESAAEYGHYRTPVMVGVLGAFTTFSAFSLETVHLLEAGDMFKASLNVLLNVILCLAACWLGLTIARAQY